MDDAIKAALAEAINVVAGNETCQLRDGSAPCTRHCECAALTAAAIAAFLRALPQCSVMLAADSGWHNTVTLAAAVENATREGGG